MLKKELHFSNLAGVKPVHLIEFKLSHMSFLITLSTVVNSYDADLFQWLLLLMKY